MFIVGGVGFDINCGVRLIRTNLSEKDVTPVKEQLAQVTQETIYLNQKCHAGSRAFGFTFLQSLFDHIPVGVGTKGIIPMAARDLEEALEMGMDWSLRQGYAWAEDKVSPSSTSVDSTSPIHSLPGALRRVRTNAAGRSLQSFITGQEERPTTSQWGHCLFQILPSHYSLSLSLMPNLLSHSLYDYSWGRWVEGTTMQRFRWWMRYTTSPLLTEWEWSERDRWVQIVC